MKQIGTIHKGSEYYELYDNGMIGRKNRGVSPTEQWAVTGAVRLNNFGYVVERMTLADVLAGKVKKWRHKNGKQQWHITDFDHGTGRMWGSPNHELWLT